MANWVKTRTFVAGFKRVASAALPFIGSIEKNKEHKQLGHPQVGDD